MVVCNKVMIYNLLVFYVFGVVKVFVGYYCMKDVIGVNGVFMEIINYLLVNIVGGNIVGVECKDDGYFFGVNYQVIVVLSLIGGVYYDKSKNVVYQVLGNVGDGKCYIVVGVVEYVLFKCIQLYIIVDYNKVKDVVVYEIINLVNGKSNLIIVGVGICYIF